MPLTVLAAAKVNLYLHVGRPAADGYHDLNSLMVFADIGDRVTLDTEGEGFRLTGPFAGGLENEGANLVTRARDRFLERFSGHERRFGLILDKALPIAAGLGGGSADAAATLHAMAEAWGLSPQARAESGALGEIARTLGADVAACLASRSVTATGRGDRLAAAPSLPVLDAVLVNPLAPSSTAAVYRAFDQEEAWAGLDAPEPDGLGTAADVAAWLVRTRNDLEGPAVRLRPEIGEVMDVLRSTPRALFARMSGSGATCFALCESAKQAVALARQVQEARPKWWVKACRLASGAA